MFISSLIRKNIGQSTGVNTSTFRGRVLTEPLHDERTNTYNPREWPKTE